MIKYSELVAAQVLTAAAVSYYTVPAQTMTAIHAVSVTNPTAAPVVVNIYRGSSSVPAGAPSRIASRVIPAGMTLSMVDAVNHKFGAGSQIFADGLGCGLNVSGVEYIIST